MFIHTQSFRIATTACACVGLAAGAFADTVAKKGEKQPAEWFQTNLGALANVTGCVGVMIQTGDHQPGDIGGTGLAMDVNSLIMGAPSDDNEYGVNAGAAYLFNLNNGAWNQVQKVLPSGLHDGDYFGYSLDMKGQNAVVSAPYANAGANDAGEIVPFHPFGIWWQTEPFITAWDGAADDHFGTAVALGTDWLVASSPWKTVNNQLVAGKIYAYRRFGGLSWGWHQDFTMPIPHAFDGLGNSLDMDGNLFVAGAPNADVSGQSDSGSVLTGEAVLISANPFAANWITAPLTPSDPQAGAHFGASVAVIGNYVYVGAPEADDPNQVDCGAVYVFYHTGYGTFQQVARLTFAISGYHFGRKIAVDGSRIVISDTHGNLYNYQQPNVIPAIAPVFKGATWSHSAYTTSFGASLAAANGQIVAGDAGYSFTPNSQEGAAFVMSPPANDECGNAVTIGQGAFEGCTWLATNDGSCSCDSVALGREVWYKIIGDASTAGPWRIHSNTDYDSMISVHTGCPATAANAVACDDDMAGNFDAIVRFNVQPGTTYLVRMSGYTDSSGAFQMFARKNTCPADVAPMPDGNGHVDIDDLVFVITKWGHSYTMADITGNNLVDIDDLVSVITSWGNCP